MANMIRFADGVVVEIVANPNAVEPVSGKTAERLQLAFDQASETVSRVLRAVISPISKAVRESGGGEAEIEFGVGFSIEGSIYIAKVATEGNITVKVKVDGAKG